MPTCAIQQVSRTDAVIHLDGSISEPRRLAGEQATVTTADHQRRLPMRTCACLPSRSGSARRCSAARRPPRTIHSTKGSDFPDHQLCGRRADRYRGPAARKASGQAHRRLSRPRRRPALRLGRHGAGADRAELTPGRGGRRGRRPPVPGPAAGGAIVNVSSHQARRPVSAVAVRDGEGRRGGLTGAGRRVRRHGIRANAVALGSIATERHADFLPRRSPPRPSGSTPS